MLSRSLSLGFALALTFLALPAFARTQEVNCQPILARAGVGDAPALRPVVSDAGLPAAFEAKAHRTLCRGLYGAYKEAQARRINTPWMLNLPVEFVANIKGHPQQAEFERKALGTPARVMRVTVELVQVFSEEELLWTVGHELGHGVLGHSMKQRSVRAGGVVAALGGAAGAVLARGSLKKGAAVVVGAAGVAAATCGHAWVGPKHEHEADEFGVRAAQHAGMTLTQVKAVAVALMNEHDAPEEGCVDKAGTGQSAHPSSAERAKRIAALR